MSRGWCPGARVRVLSGDQGRRPGRWQHARAAPCSAHGDRQARPLGHTRAAQAQPAQARVVPHHCAEPADEPPRVTLVYCAA